MNDSDGKHVESRNYLPKDLYQYVLDRVIPSQDMRRHLLQNPDLVPRNAVSDVVNNAPVPITAKLEIYKRLSNTDDFSNLPADLTDKESIDYRSIWPWSEINCLHSYVKRELLRDYFSFNAVCIEYAENVRPRRVEIRKALTQYRFAWYKVHFGDEYCEVNKCR